MTQTPDGRKPDRQNRRIDNQNIADDELRGLSSTFGSPDDPRRALWSILLDQYENSTDGADWNDVLDTAEEKEIDRSWAHEELIRRLHWNDAHLYHGNLYPHGGR